MKILRLFIYPIKGMPKLEVQNVELLQSGPLKGDRCLALFDTKGEVFSSKRSPLFSEIKMEISEEILNLSGPVSEISTSFKKLSEQKSKSFFEIYCHLQG